MAVGFKGGHEGAPVSFISTCKYMHTRIFVDSGSPHTAFPGERRVWHEHLLAVGPAGAPAQRVGADHTERSDHNERDRRSRRRWDSDDSDNNDDDDDVYDEDRNAGRFWRLLTRKLLLGNLPHIHDALQPSMRLVHSNFGSCCVADSNIPID
jgi:hypothetical protein